MTGEARTIARCASHYTAKSRHMILKIREIRSDKDINKECIVLDVTTTGNLKGYILALDIFEHSRVTSNHMRHFVFPDQKVKAGDLIVISTRYGHTTSKEFEDQTTTYFYFWSLNHLICNRQNTAMLLYAYDSQKAKAIR